MIENVRSSNAHIANPMAMQDVAKTKPAKVSNDDIEGVLLNETQVAAQAQIAEVVELMKDGSLSDAQFKQAATELKDYAMSQLPSDEGKLAMAELIEVAKEELTQGNVFTVNVSSEGELDAGFMSARDAGFSAKAEGDNSVKSDAHNGNSRTLKREAISALMKMIQDGAPLDAIINALMAEMVDCANETVKSRYAKMANNLENIRYLNDVTHAFNSMNTSLPYKVDGREIDNLYELFHLAQTDANLAKDLEPMLALLGEQTVTVPKLDANGLPTGEKQTLTFAEYIDQLGTDAWSCGEENSKVELIFVDAFNQAFTGLISGVNDVARKAQSPEVVLPRFDQSKDASGNVLGNAPASFMVSVKSMPTMLKAIEAITSAMNTVNQEDIQYLDNENVTKQAMSSTWKKAIDLKSTIMQTILR